MNNKYIIVVRCPISGSQEEIKNIDFFEAISDEVAKKTATAKYKNCKIEYYKQIIDIDKQILKD